jgi:hypothetical protein
MSVNYINQCNEVISYIKVKVKLSHYRPGPALGVPRG